ncbi:helix-turn-helix transcriptional regulator [Halochromatium roseum]|uniref:helix-turn-helix transcriptional regulator n=1 Tax=Halochromatium roseum TaxID=391920 RepID=UPI001913153B|nr:helix-turn-helix domain-containing protein [Halochromatium roseum]MBK5938123.1 hypothetical protein [Halochromatium roseum]
MQAENHQMPSRLIPECHACRMIGVSQKTMARWREAGTAPPHYLMSKKIIRYDQDALERWFREKAA